MFKIKYTKNTKDYINITLRKILRRLTQSKLISWSLNKTSLLGKCKALSLRLIAHLVDYMWPACIDWFESSICIIRIFWSLTYCLGAQILFRKRIITISLIVCLHFYVLMFPCDTSYVRRAQLPKITPGSLERVLFRSYSAVINKRWDIYRNAFDLKHFSISPN